MSVTETIRVRTQTKAELRKHIRGVANDIANGRMDRGGMAGAFWAGFGHSFFTSIHKAFLLKSAGGKDELGNKWKPLAPSTIAARVHKATGHAGSGRGLLTESQDRVWKGIYASHLSKLIARGVALPQAKSLAARLAWAILKSRGAKTILEAYGNRRVPILIDSHKLEKSLRSGILSADRYEPPAGQIFRTSGRSVVAGTDVPYAKHVHKHRKIWPQHVALWTTRAVRAGVEHAVKYAGRNL